MSWPRVRFSAPIGVVFTPTAWDVYDTLKALPKTAGTFSNSRTIYQVDRPPICAFIDLNSDVCVDQVRATMIGNMWWPWQN